MKKIICVALSFIMLSCATVPSFAQSSLQPANSLNRQIASIDDMISVYDAMGDVNILERDNVNKTAKYELDLDLEDDTIQATVQASMDSGGNQILKYDENGKHDVLEIKANGDMYLRTCIQPKTMIY